MSTLPKFNIKKNPIIVLTKNLPSDGLSSKANSSELVLKEKDKKYSIQINDKDFVKPDLIKKKINEIIKDSSGLEDNRVVSNSDSYCNSSRDNIIHKKSKSGFINLTELNKVPQIKIGSGTNDNENCEKENKNLAKMISNSQRLEKSSNKFEKISKNNKLKINSNSKLNISLKGNYENSSCSQDIETVNVSHIEDVCMLCDLNQFGNKNVIKECSHIICFSCARNFYEDKIESGEIELKCPLFNCMHMLEIESLNNIISANHYEAFKIKLKKHKNTIEVGENNNLEMKSGNFRTTMFNTVKNYNRKHLIEVSNDESFFVYSYFKDLFCSNCFQPSLYGKYLNRNIKCLSCLKTFCKFCLKPFHSEHFDKISKNHCKIYFKRARKTDNDFSKHANGYLNFWSNLIVIIFSYFLLINFIYFKTSYFLESLSDGIFCKVSKLNWLKTIIISLMKFISVCFIFIFGVILIPYFPLLLCIGR